MKENVRASAGSHTQNRTHEQKGTEEKKRNMQNKEVKGHDSTMMEQNMRKCRDNERKIKENDE